MSEKLLSRLPRALQDEVRSLLTEPLMPLSSLGAALDAYRVYIEYRVKEASPVDQPLGEKIALGCEALLKDLPDHPEAHAAVQMAVRYFVIDEDVDGDTDSPSGLDDDALVFNKVAEFLGREDLIIEVG